MFGGEGVDLLELVSNSLYLIQCLTLSNTNIFDVAYPRGLFFKFMCLSRNVLGVIETCLPVVSSEEKSDPDSFQSFLKSTIGSLNALQETGTEISSRVRKYLDKYMKGKSSDLDQLTPKQLVEVMSSCLSDFEFGPLMKKGNQSMWNYVSYSEIPKEVSFLNHIVGTLLRKFVILHVNSDAVNLLTSYGV